MKQIDWSALPDWTNDVYKPLYKDWNRFNVIFGGSGCVHGDTLLNTPSGDIKIKDFHGGIVYSFDGERIVEAYATMPSIYSPFSVYTIKTKCGKEIKVTPRHRVLTSCGYKTCHELLQEYQSSGIVASQVLGVSISGISQKVQHEDVLRSMKIAQDSPFWPGASRHRGRYFLMRCTSAPTAGVKMRSPVESKDATTS